MNNKRLTFSAAILLATFSAGSFADSGWQLFPGTKDGFIMDPTIAVMGGYMKPTGSIGDATAGVGIELSVNCPLVQPPTNRVRQQISYYNYQDGDTTMHMIEASPHYVAEIAPNLEIGGGPGFGYIIADVDGKTSNVFALQIGGSIHYRFDSFFVGADARYQLTTDGDEASAAADGIRNARATVKVGFDF